jgi:hypothetical protein
MNDDSIIPYMFGVEIRQLTDSCKKKCHDEIDKIKEFVLINSDVEAVANDIIAKFDLNLDENIHINFDEPYYDEDGINSTNNSTNFKICIPVNGNVNVLSYKPCGRYLMCSNFNANISRKNNCLVTSLSLNNFEIIDEVYIDQAVDVKMQNIKTNILTQLSYLLPEIKQHNDEVKKDCIGYLNGLITSIKQKNNVEQFSKNSKYLRVVPKTTATIEIVEQKIITASSYDKSVAPSKLSDSVRTISNESYLCILETVKEYSIYSERLPKSYKKMNEEDIRDQILNALNLKLKTATATGETFNVQGKTDIIIIDNKNICYIAECKIWNGQQKYDESIDQLLGYISSDVIFSSIIVFNKKNIGITELINERMIANSNYKRTISYGRYVFIHPSNNRMELEISVIVFNIHGNEV